MQPMLPPRSTISLDKDHGKFFVNYKKICSIKNVILFTVTYPKDNGVFFNNNSNSTNLPSSHELSSKIIDQDSTSKYRDRYIILNFIIVILHFYIIINLNSLIFIILWL